MYVYSWSYIRVQSGSNTAANRNIHMIKQIITKKGMTNIIYVNAYYKPEIAFKELMFPYVQCTFYIIFYVIQKWWSTEW
jgi:hypothetical protein